MHIHSSTFHTKTFTSQARFLEAEQLNKRFLIAVIFKPYQGFRRFSEWYEDLFLNSHHKTLRKRSKVSQRLVFIEYSGLEPACWSNGAFFSFSLTCRSFEPSTYNKQVKQVSMVQPLQPKNLISDFTANLKHEISVKHFDSKRSLAAPMCVRQH